MVRLKTTSYKHRKMRNTIEKLEELSIGDAFDRPKWLNLRGDLPATVFFLETHLRTFATRGILTFGKAKYSETER